jgi:hypothetical protein
MASCLIDEREGAWRGGFEEIAAFVEQLRS